MGKIWDMPKDFKVFRWDVTWSPTAQINTSTIVMGRFCTDGIDFEPYSGSN